MKIGVVGAGAWGTTIASLLAPWADTRLWAREPEVPEAVRTCGENRPFLPGFVLPPALGVTTNLAEVLDHVELVVVAVPAQHVRAVIMTARELVPDDALILSLSKGIEFDSCLRMTEVLAEVLPEHSSGRIGALSGPNLAREVMAGQPSATCVAFPELAQAAVVQRMLMGDTMRVYTSDDVVGCEIGGAVKNVIAIAAGVADGLGYGMNTKAALITRGLAELSRLGTALGGQPLTFLGLAGNGDLIATCSSPYSRNRSLGEGLGRGRGVTELLAATTGVAEGVPTAPAVAQLAGRVGVEMPICETVVELLAGRLTPTEVGPRLMRRGPKAELHGLV